MDDISPPDPTNNDISNEDSMNPAITQDKSPVQADITTKTPPTVSSSQPPAPSGSDITFSITGLIITFLFFLIVAVIIIIFVLLKRKRCPQSNSIPKSQENCEPENSNTSALPLPSLKGNAAAATLMQGQKEVENVNNPFYISSFLHSTDMEDAHTYEIIKDSVQPK